jgi:hypothetical protein
MTFAQTLIAAGVGGFLGYLVTFHVSEREREEAKAEALLELYAEFSADLASAVAWIRFFPEAREPDWVSRGIDSLRGELATWAATQKRVQQTLGQGWREPVERFARTSARMRLRPIPDYLMREVEAANDYVEELSVDRSDEVKAKWPDVADAVHAAIERAIAERQRHKLWAHRRLSSRG